MSGIWVFKMQMGPLMGNMRKTFGIRVKHLLINVMLELI